MFLGLRRRPARCSPRCPSEGDADPAYAQRADLGRARPALGRRPRALRRRAQRARLARAAPLLRPLRPADRARQGRLAARLRRRCGAQHFPRVDPVAIMLVEYDGQPPARPPGALPAAAATRRSPASSSRARRSRKRCAREVFEEAGVRVRDVRYVASQPWPFPSQLMIGCLGLAESLELDDRHHRDRGRALVHARRGGRGDGARGATAPASCRRRRRRSRTTCCNGGWRTMTHAQSRGRHLVRRDVPVVRGRLHAVRQGGRAGSKDEIDVEVRWMPFELNPDLPPEGKQQAKHLAEVYGRSPEEVAAMRAQMQATAARAGFPMDYTGEGDEPPAMMWNTFEAHKLLRWALADAGPRGADPAQARAAQGALPAAPQRRRPRGPARHRRGRRLRPRQGRRGARRRSARHRRPRRGSSAAARPGSTRSRASSSTAST